MHIGIIMDGNGRWATAQGLPRLSGHAQGVETVEHIVRVCPELGITTLSLFAFAIANWKRDKAEVDGLWKLFFNFFDTKIEELINDGVRVRILGDREGLPLKVREKVTESEQRSKGNDRFLLQVALNYDGIDEVARMMRQTLSEQVQAHEITSKYISGHLDTLNSEPEIVIRTGMPKAQNGLSAWRSSAFLPLQSVQSVCISDETLWPDYTKERLQEVIAYADPDARLFGGQRKEHEKA